MPSKYTLSKKADQDIEGILTYSYQQFGESQALIYARDLRECMQSLAEMPSLGRKCDDLREGYQRFTHDKHVIFYKQRKSDVFIIRVLHVTMLPDKHL